jgi:HSP20 family protein
MNRENQRIPVMVGRPQPQTRAAEARPEHAAEGTTEPQNFQTPLIDIHEGPDGLVLEADLPGATEEGVVIQLEENVLTLHAHVPSPAPEGARVVHEEYRVADFHRSFILSDEVERSRIAAELNNGVLRLTLPKAERAKTRRIEIKS